MEFHTFHTQINFSSVLLKSLYYINVTQVSVNRGVFGNFFYTDSNMKMFKIACTENSNCACNIWLLIN